MLNMSKNFLSATKEDRRVISASTKLLNPRANLKSFGVPSKNFPTQSAKSLSFAGTEKF